MGKLLELEQVCPDVGIFCHCRGQQLTTRLPVARAAELDQSLRPRPLARSIIAILIQQLSKIVVPTHFDEDGGKDVSSTLVVVRIEAENTLEVLYGGTHPVKATGLAKS